ncbi:phosphatidylserine/phosphatidylglycerophosphate/cardiolipin synthase-like enzyme [Sphingomonas jinjuensis]|uniref:Phospholipase D n=1 Tax=Sphingomonas jinjuensis TaxID=535907 RepID=A0A840FBC3_9SPHN|nr:phospholipase D-like domain-containing protein [Sphingomonas jinjuensis]MBB4153942.1 phosphatidylserine/phosphatidylglycerophosphate/cardiolipin synthase-like enzyme [Sphingomonas jinjuensis]
MASDTLLETGRNCWRIERATRARVIIDADDYFRIARAAMLTAKKQILLVGWDFDARIRFGGDVDDGAPIEIGRFISWLVKRTPGLQVHILRWDTGAIKTLAHGRTLLRIAKWIADPQVHLRLDGHHPPAGSHHQKVVVIDDAVAFCGGIDMTVDRWDTRDHDDDAPRRVEPDGTPYGPWHDATTLLEGPAARALGDMCRGRWQLSGGDELPAIDDVDSSWPTDVAADFTDVEVGIALTVPEMAGQDPRHEVEALYIDLIARTKKLFYAESQYFASRKVAEAIGKRLREPDGPEFVIVHPVTAQGWLEPLAMDTARARLVEALRDQDPHHRLRLYNPYTAGGTPIYVHAKVTIVDDTILRVGSSNFNNRSLRLDTECDIVIDAERGGNADERQTITAIRDGLLAEHLGVDVATVAATIAETRSLIETVERLRGDGRSLRPYEVPELDAVQAWLADNKILDPEGPGEMFEALSARTPLLARLRPHRPRTKAGKAVTTGAGIAAATLAAGLWWSRRRR